MSKHCSKIIYKIVKLENVNNKSLPVYEHSLPVDNKFLGLPLFATMRTDEKQKTIILDKDKTTSQIQQLDK